MIKKGFELDTFQDIACPYLTHIIEQPIHFVLNIHVLLFLIFKRCSRLYESSGAGFCNAFE